MPIRIQRKRTKGWRMPEGAVFVGRGTIWGNPFVIGQPSGVFPPEMGLRGKAETLIHAMDRDQVVAFYRDMVGGFLSPEMYPHGHEWMTRFKKKMNNGHPSEMARSYLSGKDLCCWCGPDHSCHADILLRIANS